jgi:hypothetical protein
MNDRTSLSIYEMQMSLAARSGYPSIQETQGVTFFWVCIDLKLRS